jgi:hypothetical protein
VVAVRETTAQPPSTQVVNPMAAYVKAKYYPNMSIVGADDMEPLIRLAPGKSVTAGVSGPTTCNADVSDEVRISLPNAPGHIDEPLLMRACVLVVAPFQPH